LACEKATENYGNHANYANYANCQLMGRQMKTRFASDLLENKTALVTGGGTGIGRVTALELASCGADIALMGRRIEPLEAVAKEIEALGRRALIAPGDTRDEDQIEEVCETIKKGFGTLDILVNNAGGQFASPAREMSNKGFNAVIRNNLIGSWQMTTAVARHFMYENGGRIIFVTAVTRSGFPGMAHTAAARAGVSAMMKSLAVEWAEYGILLNAVAPGTIKSEAMAQYPIPPEEWENMEHNLLGHMGRYEDISGPIVYLASELGDFVTGEEWYVDGGATLNLKHSVMDMIDPGKLARRERADE